MALSRRAIVMVWDGMRPDFIDAVETPNLWRLAERGVRFNDSHAVFPTVTRCNSASIATGRFPTNHGIPGNTFYLPEAEAGRVLNSGDNHDLEMFRLIRGGRILTAPALAESVKAHGGRTVVVGTGSPGASLLLHPETAACGDVMLNPALFIGYEPDHLVARFGPLPERTLPRTALNAYFTRVITDMVLPEMAPDLLYFWHTDPDGTVHARGVGHPDSRASIRDADANLGAIVEALAALGLADDTDLVVISDHGFSTVSGHLDVGAALIGAGLKASADSLDVIVTGGFIYVPGADPGRIETIVQCLMGIDAIGAIFTGARGDPLPGTLAMSLVGANSGLAPDIMFSPAWDDRANEHGVRGTVRGQREGEAYHGSLSPWEVKNTLVAAGPGFKQGLVSDVPAATIDIAPTLASLLGLPAQEADGRILVEALAGSEDVPSPVDREVRIAESGSFRQEAHVARVGTATYVDTVRRVR